MKKMNKNVPAVPAWAIRKAFAAVALIGILGITPAYLTGCQNSTDTPAETEQDSEKKYDAKGWNINDITDLINKNGTLYDNDGYNRAGYDKDGYDKSGYDANGLDKSGNPKGKDDDGTDGSITMTNFPNGTQDISVPTTFLNNDLFSTATELGAGGGLSPQIRYRQFCWISYNKAKPLKQTMVKLPQHIQADLQEFQQ
jgi:hypothetical protein